jgi:precorrin-6A/cobalt-precorrin-6A reductase
MTFKVLVLAGTSEARQLCALLEPIPQFQTIASFAGVTRCTEPVNATVRYGGFGGSDGLSTYLCATKIDAIIDATHPFAATITRNAQLAAMIASVPYLRLERPAWTASADDHWIEVSDLDEAVKAPPFGATLFLSVGKTGLPRFLSRPDLKGVARMIEPPNIRQNQFAILLSRPPFSVESETSLFQSHAIAFLIVKNAGGEQTQSKLIAARTLGLPVIMVRRPSQSVVHMQTVATPSEAIAWLIDQTT